MRSGLRPDVVDTFEAARRVGVEPATVRDWVRKGWLTVAGKYGVKSYYLLDDVLRCELRARRGDVLAGPS